MASSSASKLYLRLCRSSLILFGFGILLVHQFQLLQRVERIWVGFTEKSPLHFPKSSYNLFSQPILLQT